MDTEEIQRIIRSYYKNLYSTKLENVKEIDNLLDRYHLPKLNQDQVSNLNRTISRKGIEAVSKNFQTKRSKGPVVLVQNSTRTFKKSQYLYSSKCSI